MKDTLNILSIAKNVKTLGPGNRMVIWVQGCPFNCKGCITPEGIPLEVKHLVSIQKLADEIIRDNTIGGVTFSGGEPFMQASKLSILIDLINESGKAMNYICFSGFEYEALNWVEAKGLLKKLDLLIDGKYIDKLNNGIGLRGSANQNFIYLSEKLKSSNKQFEYGERNIDIRITNIEMQSIGIPNKSIRI